MFSSIRVISGLGLKTRSRYVRGYSSIPSFIDNGTSTKMTRLQNGVRVATQNSASQTATVGIWIGAGSSNETEENSGVSNMIQHLAFKGTPNRSKERIAEEVESVGARLSSYTSREQTSFSADVSPGDVPRIVELLADVVQNTSFTPDAFEKARQEVLSEERQFRSHLDDVLFDHLHTCAYQSSGLRLSVTGEPRVVKKLKESDVARFIKNNYVSSNIVVVGTGAIQHNQIVDLATNFFSNVKAAPNDKQESQYVDWVGSEVRIRDDSMHKVHAFFGMEAVGWNHPHYWSLLLLQAMIGSWDRYAGGGTYLSSRLAETASLERLGDSFQTFYTAYKNTGIFGVSAVGSDEKFDDYAFEILSEFQILANFISPNELNQAKAKVKRAFCSKLRSHAAVAEDIGRSVLVSNRHLSLPEIYARVEAVEEKDLYDVLKTYFNDVDPVVAVQGNTELFPDYHYLRSWTYWNRW